MKLSSKNAVLLSILVIGSLGLTQTARAEDEFLSLLGGDKTKTTADGKTVAVDQKADGPIVKIIKTEIPSLTAEQNIFAQFFTDGDFEKALYQWPTAFGETAFTKTPTGRALKAYILLKNGVQVYPLEQLLSINEPKKVANDLIVLWHDAAPASNAGWSYVNPTLWNTAWADILGPAVEIRIRGRATYGADQEALIKDLIAKSAQGSSERAWLAWQLVLAKATAGTEEESANAAKALALLMKMPNNPVSQDLMTLTAARLLYQNGFLDAALKYYEKVPKSSEDWFDAQEEMGWAYLRKGEPQNTIAVEKTLVQPVFASQIGPETLYLRSLALLKSCDYPEVHKSLDMFRERYKPRAKALLSLSNDANVPAVQRFIAADKIKRVKFTDLGADAAELPRFITRDEDVHQSIRTQAMLEKDAAKFGELYARSLSGGTGKVGFQAELEEQKKDIDSRVQAARSLTFTRVKAMASDETNEIAQILQKLHIVEAEVIQQLALSGQVTDATANMKVAEKKGTTGATGPDRIWFPDEKETWFDELAHYQVDLKKGCQAVKR